MMPQECLGANPPSLFKSFRNTVSISVLLKITCLDATSPRHSLCGEEKPTRRWARTWGAGRGKEELAPWEGLYNSKVGGQDENRNRRKNEKTRQKGHGGCLGCVSPPQKIGKGSFPYLERELGKMVRWEKGLIGRQCAVGMAHFCLESGNLGCLWEGVDGRRKHLKCVLEDVLRRLYQVSKLRQAVWTQVQKVGSR